MATVDDIRRIVALDNGLATVSVVRPQGTVLSTVVNAGVVAHPVTGTPVAATALTLAPGTALAITFNVTLN